MKIGLAITTNKLEDVALKFLEYSNLDPIAQVSIVNHCHPTSNFSETKLRDLEALFSSSNTQITIENANTAFHEARTRSFELLSTDIKVKWDDDHVFTSDFGAETFTSRISNAIDQFGHGIFYFQIPTFGIHPQLISKNRIFSGSSGDVFAYSSMNSNVKFVQDDLYADRQAHSAKAKAYLGNCGVLHLDQMKPFKYIVYRSQLNSGLRNFNSSHISVDEAWESKFKQPIEHDIMRLVQKMNLNPNDYFVRAPMSWVETLPKPLYALRNLSIKEFRKSLFDEELDLKFSVEDIHYLDIENLEIPNNWLHKDFGKVSSQK